MIHDICEVTWLLLPISVAMWVSVRIYLDLRKSDLYEREVKAWEKDNEPDDDGDQWKNA